MNKGGFIMDLIVGMVMIFLIAISIVTAVFFHKTITSETDIYSSTTTGQEIQTAIDTTVNMYTFIFIMSIVSVLVSLLITAHYIETSVVFLVVGIIIVAIITLVSAPLSNSFNEITSNPDLSDKLTDHTLITTIMDKFPLVNLVIGSLFLIALYAKKRRGESEFSLPI